MTNHASCSCDCFEIWSESRSTLVKQAFDKWSSKPITIMSKASLPYSHSDHRQRLMCYYRSVKYLCGCTARDYTYRCERQTEPAHRPYITRDPNHPRTVRDRTQHCPRCRGRRRVVAPSTILALASIAAAAATVVGIFMLWPFMTLRNCLVLLSAASLGLMSLFAQAQQFV